MGKKTLEDNQLTISKTRFGSKSKWPINDCRSKLNQNYDYYYYKTKTENLSIALNINYIQLSDKSFMNNIIGGVAITKYTCRIP
jgi:hypothetical protein